VKNFEILLVASTALLTANFALAQNWTQTSAPSTNWTAIAASADGTRLVAAVSGGRIYISTNSGATWTQTDAPKAFWSSVSSSADGTKLAAVAGSHSLYTGPLYTSTNSGATWTSNNVPATAWVSVASSADGNTLTALATPLLGKNAIYVSTNSGNTWVSTNISWSLNSVAASADGRKLAASGLEIFISTNSGSNWTTNSSLPYAAVAVALPVDGNKLIAIGGQLIFISTNAGTTWVQTSAPSTNWIAVASSADGSRLVAVTGGRRSLQNPVVTGPIYTSTNSGATWTSNNVPVHNWTSVASSADGCILVAADAGILSTNVPDATVGGGIWIARTTPVPQMNIIPINGNFTLSWVMPSTNFVMQQSSDLGSWMDMTNKPVLNLTNLQNEVILSPTGSNVFYRLKTP
jgi:hypothetical protein